DLGALLRPNVNRGWRWSSEIHRFQGNVLFADGHVEEKNNKNLAFSLEQPQLVGDLALPNLPRFGPIQPPLISGSPTPTLPKPAVSQSNERAASAQPTLPNQRQVNVVASRSHVPGLPPAVTEPVQQPVTNSKPDKTSAPPPPTPATKPSPSEEPGFSLFPTELGTQIVHAVKESLWLLYLLALLVAAVAFYARSRADGSRKRRIRSFKAEDTD
ncbi:MAG TPA: hypothetical protein VL793_07255, partial [Patescibacteria group bacterium]|nr:hypothetical protein [Patescibacteria group bacterium]